MKKLSICLLALALLVALPASASKKTAANTYFTFNSGSGCTDFKDPSVFTGMVDDEDTQLSIGGGFPILPVPWLAAELAYEDFGTTEFDGLFTFMGVPTPDFGEIETTGFTASLVGKWQIKERFALIGRAGAFIFDVEENEVFGGVPERNTASGTSPVFGFGVEFRAGKRVDLRIEQRSYLDVGEVGQTGEGDIDSLTAGVVIRIKKR